MSAWLICASILVVLDFLAQVRPAPLTCHGTRDELP